MGFAIYVSCMTAPGGRVAISSFYFLLVLAMFPRQLELVREIQPFAVTEWKMLYWTIFYLASGVVPLLMMIGIKYWPKIIDRKETAEPGSIGQ